MLIPHTGCKEITMSYVLIVDDDEEVRRILGIIVKGMGFDIALCETVEEVQNLFPENEAEAKRIDLVAAIVDGKFPERAGMAPDDRAGEATVKHLRLVRGAIPILAMSSRDPERITWGRPLPKPFTIPVFKAALTELVSPIQPEPS